MSSHGLVAPARVLLDGGSYYSMAGISLRAQLGLTAADMDAGGHKVHAATGKIESLPGGLTKNPVPIVLNKGEPSEVTLYERRPSRTLKGMIYCWECELLILVGFLWIGGQREQSTERTSGERVKSLGTSL